MADLSIADGGAARHGSASRSQQHMKVEVCGMTKIVSGDGVGA